MALRPIYYDTETTGLKADRDRIVEIAAYDPVRDQSFCKLINPLCPIPSEASAVHHITDDMVADAPTFDVIGHEFIEFCGTDSVLIAHNNDAFDIHFLRWEFQRASIPMPSWTFLDSLKWARRYRSDLPKHTLQFLREIYCIPANNAHRALDDVIVLHRVFSLMIDDLPLEKVLELMQKPTVITHMPFGKHQGQLLKDVPSSYVKWLKENGALDKPENKELLESFIKVGVL